MRIGKDRLDFLKFYVGCVDNSTQLSDKVFINVKKNHIDFVQMSSNVDLFHRVEAESNEEFSLYVPTNLLFRFVESLPDGSDFMFHREGVIIDGEDTDYGFSSYDRLSPFDTDKYYEKLLSTDCINTFSIHDIDDINICKKYVGKNLRYSIDCMAYMDDCFVASDQMRTCVIKTDNATGMKGKKNMIFFPQSILSIFTKLEEKIEIRNYENNFIINYNDIFFTVKKKRYDTPYIFDPAIFAKFDHRHKFIVDQKIFDKALSRMKLFAEQNPGTRIWLSVKNNSLTIENRDFNKSRERIDLVECDKELNGLEFAISGDSLWRAVMDIDSKNVMIYASQDNTLAIRVEDETGRIKIILVLLRV